MGRMLGSFDGDNELDRPDLNKCPDCECYFAQDNCPLCGKECPPEMRAGNRKAVKKKHARSGSGRVTFVEWYHSWWFIILMLILFPLVGVILLITSPHKKSYKVALIGACVIYTLVGSIGLGNIIPIFVNTFDPPVNAKLSFEEYAAKCVEVDAEDYFREPDKYKGQYIKMTVAVTSAPFIDIDCRYGNKYSNLFMYSIPNTSSGVLLFRECFVENINLMLGDTVTVYGQAVGNTSFTDQFYQEWDLPCINVAYAVLKNPPS